MKFGKTGKELTLVLIVLLLLAVAASVWVNLKTGGVQSKCDKDVQTAKEQMQQGERTYLTYPTPDFSLLWPAWFSAAAIGLAAGFLLGRHAA